MTGYRTHKLLDEHERKAMLARRAECDNEIARMFAVGRDAEESPIWRLVATVVAILGVIVIFSEGI